MRNILAIAALFAAGVGGVSAPVEACENPYTKKACVAQTGKQVYTYGQQILNIQFQNTCSDPVQFHVRTHDDRGKVYNDSYDLKPGQFKTVECNWPGKVAQYCIEAAVSVCGGGSASSSSPAGKSNSGATAAAAPDEDANNERAEPPPSAESSSASTNAPQNSATVPTFRVLGNVSQGILNMRDGPGQKHAVVAAIPAGSGGIRFAGACQAPDDGQSRYRWCKVNWNGNVGWVSQAGLTMDGSNGSSQESAPSRPVAQPRALTCMDRWRKECPRPNFEWYCSQLKKECAGQ